MIVPMILIILTLIITIIGVISINDRTVLCLLTLFLWFIIVAQGFIVSQNLTEVKQLSELHDTLQCELDSGHVCKYLCKEVEAYNNIVEENQKYVGNIWIGLYYSGGYENLELIDNQEIGTDFVFENGKGFQ